MSNQYFLEMDKITKKFPGVTALNEVVLQVKQGEIHGICGENGAGKSTLIKVMSGVYPKGSYTGDIKISGRTVSFKNIKDAENEGIVCIHQELALVPDMSVAENIFLGNQPNKGGFIDWNKIYYETEKLLEMVGINRISDENTTKVTGNTLIKNLGIGQQQLVEIAKALNKQTKVLILDEPTAALTETEVDILLSILRKIRADGITCIYISHKLDEVINICDSVTIFRDGCSVDHMKKEALNKRDIIKNMVGRDMVNLFPKEFVDKGEAVLEVRNFSVYNPISPSKKLVNDVSFTAYKGQVLGISGLMGAGRTELFMGIIGAFSKTEGEVYIAGQKLTINTPYDAINNGIMIVTEDRKHNGLVLDMDIKNNTTMASLSAVSNFGWLDKDKEIVESQKYMEYLRTRANSVDVKTKNLSGGNQQKVVIAKALMTQPKVLIMDEPTRGIDVGAKYEIYKIINQLVADGVAVIMISSELEEVIGMSDRIMVMSEGVMQKILEKDEISQTGIMNLAIGGCKQ